MPISFEKLEAIGKTTIRLDFGDEGDLNLEVYPNRLTISRQMKIQEAVNANDMSSAAEVFFALVQSWDLLDAEGKPMPMTEETLSSMGIGIIGEIMERLQATITAHSDSYSTSLRTGVWPKKSAEVEPAA